MTLIKALWKKLTNLLKRKELRFKRIKFELFILGLEVEEESTRQHTYKYTKKVDGFSYIIIVSMFNYSFWPFTEIILHSTTIDKISSRNFTTYKATSTKKVMEHFHYLLNEIPDAKEDDL